MSWTFMGVSVLVVISLGYLLLAAANQTWRAASTRVLEILSAPEAAILTSAFVLVGAIVQALWLHHRATRALETEALISATVTGAMNADRDRMIATGGGAIRIGEDEASARKHFLGDVYDNDMHRGRVFARLVSTMVAGSRVLSFETPSALLGTFEPEITEHARRLREVQTSAIRLGILFTFVGLIGAMEPVTRLFGLGAAAPPSPSEIGNLMREVVGSLGLAFGTSIAGLAAALAITWLIADLRRREDALLVQVQDVAQGLQFVLRNSAMPSSVNKMFDDHVKHLAEHTLAMKDHALNVSEAQRALKSQLEAQDTAIQTFITDLKAGRNALSDVVRTQQDEVARLGQAYRDLVGAEDRIAQGLEAALQKGAAAGALALGSHVETVAAAVKGITPLTDTAADRLAATTTAQVTALEALLGRIEAGERARRRWLIVFMAIGMAMIGALLVGGVFGPELRRALGVAPLSSEISAPQGAMS